MSTLANKAVIIVVPSVSISVCKTGSRPGLSTRGNFCLFWFAFIFWGKSLIGISTNCPYTYKNILKALGEQVINYIMLSNSLETK